MRLFIANGSRGLNGNASAILGQGAFLWGEAVEHWKQEGWHGTPLDDFSL